MEYLFNQLKNENIIHYPTPAIDAPLLPFSFVYWNVMHFPAGTVSSILSWSHLSMSFALRRWPRFSPVKESCFTHTSHRARPFQARKWFYGSHTSEKLLRVWEAGGAVTPWPHIFLESMRWRLNCFPAFLFSSVNLFGLHISHFLELPTNRLVKKWMKCVTIQIVNWSVVLLFSYM